MPTHPQAVAPGFCTLRARSSAPQRTTSARRSRPISCSRALAKFVTLLLFMLAPVLAQAQPATPNTEPNYQVPQELAQLAAVLQREADALAERHRAAVQAFANPDLGDLQPLQGTHPNDIQRDYAEYLAVAQTPDGFDAWTALQKRLATRETPLRAAAAAVRMRTLAPSAPQQADALLLMADAMTAAGQPRDARNVAALAYQADPTAARQRAYAAVEAKTRFRILSVDTDMNRPLPSACVRLSEPLRARQPIPLADLVSVTPNEDIQPRIEGDRLCVDGLRYGATYTIKLFAGLTSENGSRLTVPLTQSVTVGNRDARVTFTPGAYVLPRSPSSVLPVRTVNMNEVPLRLYRINDRNLVRAVLDDLINSNLSGWERQRVADEVGAEMWKGVLEVSNELNREVITNLPLDELLASREAGVYALTSPHEEEWAPGATQWLVVSNLALTALDALDGMHVFARGLDDARPVSGAEVTLLARNNAVLGTVRTNGSGYAQFNANLSQGKGGNAPALLMVNRRGDFNFLRLSGAGLDLSERGAEGRAVPGAIDAYIYSERGVYRPGETVHVNVLLRDRAANAVAATPLRLKLTRPGGVVMLDRSEATDELGSLQVDIPLSAAAFAGTWGLEAFLDPEAPAVGQVQFQVEDFVPPRIEVQAAFANAPLKPEVDALVTVNARYYYGAAGAELNAGAQLRIEVDPTPFPDYAAFSFGREDLDFRPVAVTGETTKTNAAGDARFQFRLPPLTDQSQPLRARLIANVFDVGGRPVTRTGTAPIVLHPRYVGIDPQFDGSVPEGGEARFRVVALTPDGAASAGSRIRIAWLRENYEYVWFEGHGAWNYRQIVTTESLGSAYATADDTGSAQLTNALPPGRYRLEVYDEAGSASASTRFSVGWYRAGAPSDTPDALKLTVTNAAPDPGTTVNAFIEAPFAGRALVTVVNENLLDSFEVDLPKEGRRVDLKVKDNWSPGAYVLVTAFRANAAEPSPLPTRAMGMQWLSVGTKARTLTVNVSAPDVVQPRQTVRVPIEVQGAGRGDSTIGITLAAVDEGVLALTRYESPDPAAYFFGQRLFYPDAYDLYGSLIAPQSGPLGRVRAGGDASVENLAGVSARSSRVVAMFHRVAKLDDAGRTTVDVTLPDFNGRLRLMAVAYNKTKLGSHQQPLTVRDPLVADLILPRFLAPGDRATATLDVKNPGDEPLTADITLQSSATVPAQFDPQSVTLPPRGGRRLPVVLSAGEPGLGTFELRVAIRGGETIARDFQLSVRAAAPVLSRRTVQELAPGGSVRLDAALLAPFYPAGRQLTALVTGGLGVDISGLLGQLTDYPYGCTEQVLSQSLPQLYVKDGDAANRSRAAVAKVLDRQSSDGQFGLWSAAGEPSPWLSAYAYDYLTRARAEGLDVPAESLQLTETVLRNLLDGGEPHAAAYAAYVLARNNAVKAADVRRFALNRTVSLKTRLALGHRAAALALIGEADDARRGFTQALGTSRGSAVVADFGSDLRDGAATLSLLAELPGFAALRGSVAEQLDRALSGAAWWSTQEQAWLVTAAQQLSASDQALAVTINGAANAARPLQLTPSDGELQQGLNVTNQGAVPLRIITTVRGTPSGAAPTASDGYQIQRSYFDGERGTAIDPNGLQQGDLVLVVLTGQSERRTAKQSVLVVDLLPAGLEIENAKLGDVEQQQSMAFLGPISAVDIEMARDDRYVAALTMNGASRFRVAYLARAITPGQYVHPGTQVEDMYAPRFRALGEGGTVRVQMPGAGAASPAQAAAPPPSAANPTTPSAATRTPVVDNAATPPATSDTP